MPSSDNQNNLFSVLKSRKNVVALKSINLNPANPFTKIDENNLLPPDEKFPFKSLINKVNPDDKISQIISKQIKNHLATDLKKYQSQDYKSLTQLLETF